MLRALLAATSEPKAKEEPQSEPSGVEGMRHRTPSIVVGTETEVSSCVGEPCQPEDVPLQIVTQPGENRRMRLDQRARSSSATNSPRLNNPLPSDSSSKLAHELHDGIDSFIQTGASSSAAHTLTEDCKICFQENSPTKVRNHTPPSSR